MHGVAWLPSAPDVEQLLRSTDDTVKQEIIQYANRVVLVSGDRHLCVHTHYHNYTNIISIGQRIA